MLKVTARHYLSSRKNILDILDHALLIMSPQHVLSRGFAIVRHQGQSIGANSLQPGDKLEIETLNYQISSTVNKIDKK
jgi:exodeoxyribonuclease VII large subunit